MKDDANNTIHGGFERLLEENKKQRVEEHRNNLEMKLAHEREVFELRLETEIRRQQQSVIRKTCALLLVAAAALVGTMGYFVQKEFREPTYLSPTELDRVQALITLNAEINRLKAVLNDVRKFGDDDQMRKAEQNLKQAEAALENFRNTNRMNAVE